MPRDIDRRWPLGIQDDISRRTRTEPSPPWTGGWPLAKFAACGSHGPAL